MNPPLRPLAAPPDLAFVDQDDIARRVTFLGDHCGPQPGVAAADDAQVAVFVAHERRVRLRDLRALEPERVRLGVGDGVECELGRFAGCCRVAHDLTGPGVYPSTGSTRPATVRPARRAVRPARRRTVWAWTSESLDVAPLSLLDRQASDSARPWRWRRRGRTWRSAAATSIGSRRRRRSSVTSACRSSPMSRPPRARRAFVAAAIEALGAVDILVTNAGGPPPGNFATTSVEAYQSAIDLNLMSVVAMCKAAVPAMQERRWGRVVAITSLSVRQPIAQLILSNTARAGATGFLKTLALEVAADGVTVNSIQPGLHRTPRVTQLYSEDQQGSMRMGDANDFGAVAAFLCSEQAKFTTGVQLHVDGGAYLGLL